MKENWFENIERYLHKEMTTDELEAFEKEVAANEELASLLSVYKTVDTEMVYTETDKQKEEALKESLQKLNAVYFTGEKKESADIGPAPVRRMGSRRWLNYAVAAALLLFIAGYYYFNQSTPEQLAKKYIASNLTQLSQTMDGSRDSLQLGIAAYNNKDYNKAIAMFSGVYTAHPDNIYAKKYTGLTYLMMEDYTHALNSFSELAAIKGLYSNPGMFLQAVTLLQRGGQSDRSNAKQLLERVVHDKQEGYRDAEEWLKKWKD
ncbi:hypothetical protein QTN47_11190 [Danxiaibacter flavus]|uniref:Tetratricopeptide repeat protein n=1 Tax=Danxiaibacter flavus TaxID=3049108 RepID=A0ABV3ZE11_9BACT|nr:hypothetical protein QNM32_11195 [Chitinophagaceae bacterium DXS]